MESSPSNTACLKCGKLFREHRYGPMFDTSNMLPLNKTSETRKFDVSLKVAAHKYFFSAHISDSSFYTRVSKLQFDTNNQVDEYTNGVTLTKNGIVIKVAGLYYVYYSICVQQEDDSTTSTSFFTYLQRISYNSPSSTGMLLKSMLTAHNTAVKTTFTGGIFMLKAGDKLQVFATAESFLLISKSTFIGLFLLHPIN